MSNSLGCFFGFIGQKHPLTAAGNHLNAIDSLFIIFDFFAFATIQVCDGFTNVFVVLVGFGFAIIAVLVIFLAQSQMALTQ